MEAKNWRIQRGHLAAAITIAALLTAATGCGAEEEAPTAKGPAAEPGDEAHSSNTGPNSRPSIDVSVVSGGGSYDYAAVGSVAGLMERASSVTLGEVVGWSDGRSVVEGYADRSYTDTELYAVLEVAIDTSYKSFDGQQSADRIFIEIPRGGQVREGGELPGDGYEPVLEEIAELEEAVPPGTRVIIGADRAPTSEQLANGDDVLEVNEAPDGPPEGTSLLWPDIQGLLFEEANGDFASGLTPGDEDSWGWVPTNARSSLEEFQYLVQQLENASSPG